MSPGLNPIALAAATLSLGAHVAVFGVLLFDPADEPAGAAHLVDIVISSALPSPPNEPQATKPSIASERQNPPAQKPAPNLPTAATPEIMPALTVANLPVSLRSTPAPTIRATPRNKPVSQTSGLESISIVESPEMASLEPAAAQRSPARSTLSIETQIAAAPGNAQPRYPLIARKRGYEGQTIVRAQVSKSGQVISVNIASSSGHDVLDLAAQDAVADWHFRPATHDGRPTAGQIDVPIEFRLR